MDQPISQNNNSHNTTTSAINQVLDYTIISDPPKTNQWYYTSTSINIPLDQTTTVPGNSTTSDELFEIEISNTDCSNNSLKDLLVTWGVENVLTYFIEQNITIEILKIMKKDHILNVLKQFDWGTIIKFEHSFENWRFSIGKPLTAQVTDCVSVLNPDLKTNASLFSYSQQTSPSGSSSTSQIFNFDQRCSTPGSSTEPQISLANILNETVKGTLLVKWYAQNQKFHEEQRNMLITIIAQYFDDKKLTFNLSTSHKIEREIIERFPSEKLEFYRTSLRGKIYNKFCNSKCKMRLAFKGKLDTILPTDKTNHTAEKPVADADVQNAIRSLKFDNLSAEQFDHVWQSCSDYRIKNLKDLSVVEIYKTWPQYKTPAGYRLIDMDYSAKFGQNFILLEDWARHIDALLQLLVLDDRIKDKSNKEYIKKIKEQENLTENTKFAATLWCLHGYLVPTGKLVNKDAKGLKNVTKFTIKDSQDSFLYIAGTYQELTERTRFLTEKGNNIQPYIMSIGENIFSLSEFYVYSDGNMYKFTSFVRSIDICFKIFYLFNIEYPKSSTSFWHFIEKYFYNMNSSAKKKFSRVEILISDLKSALE